MEVNNKKNTLVINIHGGPCAGKSTVAAGLFCELKKLGYNCELVTEYAKDKVWEESYKLLENQFAIFGNQHLMLWQVNHKVDIIITDSPLIMIIYYAKHIKSKYFKDLIAEQFNNFNNINFFINRGEKYEPIGRVHTEEEAKQIDQEIKDLMHEYNIEYTILNQKTAVQDILNIITKNDTL